MQRLQGGVRALWYLARWVDGQPTARGIYAQALRRTPRIGQANVAVHAEQTVKAIEKPGPFPSESCMLLRYAEPTSQVGKLWSSDHVFCLVDMFQAWNNGNHHVT